MAEMATNQGSENRLIDNLDMFKSNPELESIENDYGLTALHITAEIGNVKFFKSLVEDRLDPYSVSNRGETVLHKACQGDQLPMAKYIATAFPLLKSMVNENEFTALHYAAQFGSLNLFKFLIDEGLEVNSVNEGGGNVLHIASWNGRCEMAAYILSKYPELKNSRSKDNETALHYSINGGLDVLKLLVDNGLDVYDEYKPGFNVLFLAADFGSYTMVEYLMMTYPKLAAARTNLPNRMTTLDAAQYISSEKGFKHIENFLIKCRARMTLVADDRSKLTEMSSLPKFKDRCKIDVGSVAESVDVSSDCLETIKVAEISTQDLRTRSARLSATVQASSGDLTATLARLSVSVPASSDQNSTAEECVSKADGKISVLDLVEIRCDTCKKKTTYEVSKARWFCQDCCDCLCHQCKSYHELFRPTSTHTIISLQPNCEMCMDGDEGGKENIAEWYCKECEEFICQACRNYHKRLRKSRNHVVIDSREEIKKITRSKVQHISLG